MDTVQSSRRPQIAACDQLVLDQELFAKLKALRNEIADKEHTPLYMIFANVSLQEMATYYPQTLEEFASMKGVGQFKVRKYGDQFLSCIVAYAQDHKLTSKVQLKPKDAEKTQSKDMQKSVETSALYFKQGLSIDEIAILRKITTKTVISHLVQAYENGADITIDAFIPVEKQQSITEIFHRLGTMQLTTVMEKLSGYSYNDMRWVRAKLLREDAPATTA